MFGLLLKEKQPELAKHMVYVLPHMYTHTHIHTHTRTHTHVHTHTHTHVHTHVHTHTHTCTHPLRTNEDDFTPVDLAVMLNHTQIAKMLLAKGAKDSTKCMHYCTVS